MRILLLIHSLRRGGAERVVLELALGLQAKGHNVELVSWLKIDEYPDVVYSKINRSYLTSNTSYPGLKGIPKAAAELNKIIKEKNPDVIEMHSPTVAWIAAWARIRIPCIEVIHGYDTIEKKKSFKNLILHLLDIVSRYQLSSKLITVSSKMIPISAKYFFMSSNNVNCVFNGINIDRFFSPIRCIENEIIIVMVGTLCKNKGQHLAINTASLLFKKFDNVKLHIVGNGSDRLFLKELIQDLDLTGKVELLGRRDDIPEILENAHIFWHLSKSEAFLPLAAMEAMATGLPILGFDVQGMNDVLIEGKTGFLSAYGDIKSLADNTEKILLDKNLYTNISRNNRNLIENKFTLEFMINGHEQELINICTSR